MQLHVQQKKLVIEADHRPRLGWKQAFAVAGSSAQDPLLLDRQPPNQFDTEEWTW